MPQPQPEVVSQDDEHALVIVGGVLLQLWLRSVPVPAAGRVVAAGDRLAAGGQHFATMIVVAADAKPPVDGARRQLVQFGKTHATAMRACVLVVEATGLKGAIMRSLMTGMSMLVPQIPVFIVRSVEEGLITLQTHAPDTDPAALLRVIGFMRGSKRPPPGQPLSRAHTSV